MKGSAGNLYGLSLSRKRETLILRCSASFAPALTLLETIAALVLLALIASASVSLIREVRMAGDAPPPNVLDRTLLGRAADAILADPKSHGLPEKIAELPPSGRDVSWPAEVDPAGGSGGDAGPNELPSISVRPLAADLPETDPMNRLWLLFEADDVQTVRCVALPVKAEPTPARGAVQ